jgi:hypothetical protein
MAEYYKKTYNLLSKKVLSSQVLYADETPIKTKVEDAYAWVFTNNREVVSFYKPTREGSFLPNFLNDFTGIIVTDFYSAYDSIECLHQKCLIHLMRDFNDDLLKNPFNDEFKKMAHDFTIILQDIVKTIDRYGLKKRHLNKHRKEAALFIRTISQTEFETEISKQYKLRITKYKNALFQFLNHDNVSWNNSNAEHAIRLLATHTNKNIWFFQSKAVDEYLLLLSIYQTCEYNNISFLKFLLSKEKNLVEYIHRNI